MKKLTTLILILLAITIVPHVDVCQNPGQLYRTA